MCFVCSSKARLAIPVSSMAVVDYPTSRIPADCVTELSGIELEDVKHRTYQNTDYTKWAYEVRSEFEHTMRVPLRLAFLLKKSLNEHATRLKEPLNVGQANALIACVDSFNVAVKLPLPLLLLCWYQYCTCRCWLFCCCCFSLCSSVAGWTRGPRGAKRADTRGGAKFIRLHRSKQSKKVNIDAKKRRHGSFRLVEWLPRRSSSNLKSAWL